MSSPTPSVGDEVYLGSVLANLHFWGVVADLDVPTMARGSFELNGTDGNITLDALVGDQGVPGTPSPIVDLQYDATYTDPSQLPTNLENNSIDIGKAYWIGNQVYVWSGTNWFARQMGTAGPIGITPDISASAALIPSGIPGTSLTQPIVVSRSGTDENPNLYFQFDHDSIMGPTGPSGPIRDAADYNNTTAPADGDAILWSAALQKFFPGVVDMLVPQVFSVPEAQFTSYTGLGTRQQIMSYAIPPQPFAWKPLVLGHIRTFGVDLTITPLTIGVEITLGDPVAGQRIGRGFGNISNYALIIPHFSTPTSQGDAITPTNELALVPAYHTGSQGTIYASLYNDGAIGEFVYQNQNSQLLIMCVPIGPIVAPPGS